MQVTQGRTRTKSPERDLHLEQRTSLVCHQETVKEKSPNGIEEAKSCKRKKECRSRLWALYSKPQLSSDQRRPYSDPLS